VLAEAAIASFLHSSIQKPNATNTAWQQVSAPSWLDSRSDFQPRTFQFQASDFEPGPGKTPEIYTVEVQQTGPGHFSVKDSSNQTSNHVSSSFDAATHTLTTYFPHTRHTSHIIFSPSTTTSTAGTIHLFTPDGSFRLTAPQPSWLSKALGVVDKPNSLLSPMPAKILRVLVKPGDTVTKDQPLLVIESMKMETVIRSPAEGMVVKRVVHSEGEVVGSGVELVEFEEEEDDAGKGDKA